MQNYLRYAASLVRKVGYKNLYSVKSLYFRCEISYKIDEGRINLIIAIIFFANKAKLKCTIFLCRSVPGIPINQPLPRDPVARVLQLHWQHSTLLTFLRGQGASVSAIRPEFLLTPRDYRRWVKIKEKEAAKGKKDDNVDNPSSTPDIQIAEDLFESVSKRAWTDMLLQMFKVK